MLSSFSFTNSDSSSSETSEKCGMETLFVKFPHNDSPWLFITKTSVFCALHRNIFCFDDSCGNLVKTFETQLQNYLSKEKFSTFYSRRSHNYRSINYIIAEQLPLAKHKIILVSWRTFPQHCGNFNRQKVPVISHHWNFSLICELLWVFPILKHDAWWWWWRRTTLGGTLRCSFFRLPFCQPLSMAFIVQQPASQLFIFSIM